MKSALRVIHGERGFSMMEMMIVVVLIGLMASLAAPSWFEQMPRLESQAQVKEVVSKLREARSLAIARKEPAGICFDAGSNLWTVFLDNGPCDNAYNTGDSVVSDGQIGMRVSMSYNSFTNADVLFNPDGTCFESGTICLTAADNSVSYTIDVLASTGRVRMVEGYFPYGS